MNSQIVSGPLANAAAFEVMAHNRLHDKFSADQATLCFQALCRREPHLLRQANINAVVVYQKEGLRIYRLRAEHNEVYVSVYLHTADSCELRWAESDALLLS